MLLRKFLAIILLVGCNGQGQFSKSLSPSDLPKTTDSIIRLPQYASVRYVAPPSFKASTRILFWTKAYGSINNWNFWFTRAHIADTCPELADRCHFTTDRSLLDVSDAVVFMTYSDNFDLRGNVTSQLPPCRSPGQRWVHLSLEPPFLQREMEDLRPLDGLFNWTLNYRRDADIYAPFGRVVLNRLPTDRLAASMRRDYAANKTKLASWFVSHCPTDGKREDYVSELQKYVPVDVYGDCGPFKCEPRQSDACYKMADADYKFYLAFENLLCRDYVTEKFFRALTMDVVPVVFGGADYSLYAPAGSYINALEFDGPAALAERLLFLDANPDEYNAYFDWKRGYSASIVQAPHFVCGLCMKLLDPEQPVKHYSDLDEWWNGRGECRAWHPKNNFGQGMTRQSIPN